MIDIEGGELELLTFEFLSEFKSSEFLIELHSSGVWLGNEKEERLVRDAQVLFDVELVDDIKRDLLQLRNELQMPDDLTWVLASEGSRYPMRWLHFKPKREPKNAALPRKRSEQKKDQKFGTLWMGGEPGKLERACLNSMKDFGYNPIVFSYEPIRNLPEGVEYFDAREIYEPGRVIRHVRHKSPAIHADIFRYHLISKTGMIWLDNDMYMVASAERLMVSANLVLVFVLDVFCRIFHGIKRNIHSRIMRFLGFRRIVNRLPCWERCSRRTVWLLRPGRIHRHYWD